MTVTANQFERACKDFKKYAKKENINVSFSYGFFFVSGSKNALENILKSYGKNPNAYIENNMFILSTSFRGNFETVTI